MGGTQQAHPRPVRLLVYTDAGEFAGALYDELLGRPPAMPQPHEQRELQTAV